jgi:hypothetical protein
MRLSTDRHMILKHERHQGVAQAPQIVDVSRFNLKQERGSVVES